MTVERPNTLAGLVEKRAEIAGSRASASGPRVTRALTSSTASVIACSSPSPAE